MRKLKDILRHARDEKWAVPHFNISDLAMLHGLIEAAQELKSPLLIGTSEGESDFLGRREAVALIKIAREAKKLEIYLNADHCHSLKTAKAAVDAGYDSVHIDLSKLSSPEEKAVLLKLLAYPKAVAEAAQNYSPNTVCDYLVGLAQAFNTFYHKHQVLKAEDKATRQARLLLIKAVQIVLANGLGILGMAAPEKM